jgi:hypothetical protein
MLSQWLYSPLDLGRFFSFLIIYTVGRTPWTGDQPVARPLLTHRTTQTQNKRTQTSMPHWDRTHDPSVRADEDGSCLRSRGHYVGWIKYWTNKLNITVNIFSPIKKNKYNSNNVYKEWVGIDSINRPYKIGPEVREVLIDLDKDGVEGRNRFTNLIPGYKLLI